MKAEKKKILAVISLLMAVIMLIMSFSACGGLCKHKYEFNCSDTCLKCGEKRTPNAHTYAGTSLCEDLICECGYVLEQSHDLHLDESTDATLVSSGTVIFSCSKCGEKEIREEDSVLSPELLGMPTVYIYDITPGAVSLSRLEKYHGEITVRCKYVGGNGQETDFECYTKIKVQGASSAQYPKKNFTVKFYEDEELQTKKKVDLGWGKENKYCLKANYIDVTQARNIVSARLFAQAVPTRSSISDGLKNAPNYGVVDGFPTLVYINDIFHGIYTMNIPKDEWMFGMEGDEDAKEAILMADQWSDYVRLKQPLGEIASAEDFASYKFELEYASNEDDVAWIRDSFNELIELINCGDGEKIRASLASCLDVSATIDNMLFTYFIGGGDNVAKNILWATYDGKIWIPSMYDMDSTFGLEWTGQPIGTKKADGYPKDSYQLFPSSSSGNKLWDVLIRYFPHEVQDRYTFLREEIMTLENVEAAFNEFAEKIHPIAFASDVERWDTASNNNKVSYTYASVTGSNMLPTTSERLEKMDIFFLRLG